MKNTVKKIVGFTVALFALVGVASSASAAACTSYTFGSGLYQVGSNNSYVKEIQQFLNANGSPIATSGAGSAGYETTKYGPKTRTAVIAFQAAHGVVPTSGKFGPVTRAAALAVQSANCGTNPQPPQNGPVSVSLSSNTPASGTLVAGQATADLAHFTFSGNGVVTNVTLQRIGVSADSTPSNVYLFDGANRLTDASSVSNNGMITFNVPAGIFSVAGSKNISVKSDIALSASGQTVGVKLVSFMTSGSTASTVNISGNLHSIASATLASITHGTVTPSGATINPASGVTLWQDTLTISQRDVWMKRIAFRQVGSAPASAFQNFKLYVNGSLVGTASGLDSMGYVTFDLNASPVLLVSGSRVVRVDADVVSGASRTVQLSLRQASDVDFVDSSYGVNVTPTSTHWTASSASTISGTSGGSLTIEKDVSSPSTNVTLSGSDVNLGTFKVTAYGEPIKIETLTAGFTFTDGGTVNAAATLRNGRLLINGVQYGSSATLLAAGTSFTTNYTVYPGTSVLVEVRADIYDNDGTGSLDSSDTLLAKIIAGSSNAQRVDSLGSFNAPASAVSANTLSVASASATLVKNSTYANQSTTLPATNFKIGSWNLTGSSVEDILLTTLSFDVDEVVSTEFDEGDITNMYAVVTDSVTGAVVAQPSPLGTVAAADNNFSINYTLLKNKSVKIELFGNLSDDGSDSAIDAADSFKTDLTVSGTALVSGTSVNPSSGDIDGQTIAYGAATITATADASTPVAAIVYDNQTVTSAAFKFAAVTSGYNVTDLTLTIGDATTVSNVMLYDGATLVASQAGAATVTFSGLNWNVPANTNKVLTVKLQLGAVGIGAGSTGASLLTTLTAFTASSTSTGVSDASANDAGPSIENNPAGNAMYVYAATPTITNVALPTSTLTNGTATVSKFSVASNGGTIGWKYFAFTITKVMSGTDTLASATLWDVDSNTQIAGTATFTGSVETDNDTAGGLTFVATDEQQVSGTKTYALKMTVAGATTNGDYMTVSIAQPLTAYDAPDAYADVLTDDATATFVWTDQSASAHDATTDDWNHGYLVKNLPTDTQVLTY